MRSSALLRLSVCLLPLLSLASPTQGGAVETSTAKVLGRAPLAFEPNLGQSDPQVRYLARGAGYALFLTRDEAVLALMSGSPDSLRQSVLRMKPLGSQAPESLEPEQSLQGRSHYARVSGPGKALRDVPRYGRVRAKGVYPGIDLVYYGNGQQLEYDFVVAPGADPDRIRLGFEGAESLALDEAGNLRLRLATGEVVQHAPVLYQEADGRRRPVTGRFVLDHNAEGLAVGFEVGAYDPALPLVIDPVLAWASLLGGSSTEWTFDVAVTPNGQAYACGYTHSTNFPTRPSATDPDLVDADAYVTKFNLDGSGIDWSTYVGGPGYQSANAIALDYNRSSYVTGTTNEDAWVFQLDAAGNLQWSRVLGGVNHDAGNEIFVDSSLNAYVAGTTFSSDFRGPNANPNVAQPGYGGEQDAFVAKLNRFGTVLYTTYYGGPKSESGNAIALDLSGRMVFTGTVITYDPYSTVPLVDAFAVRLSADGSAFQGQLTFGGSGDEYGTGIAVDPSGNVWVAGTTYSTNFPTTTATAIRNTLNGESDAFLARLFSSWAGFSYSTYLGNAQKQVVVGLLADDAGRLYPVGQVSHPDAPGLYDIWAARYTPSTNTASTITFPASGNDYTGGCAMDSSRWIYIAGVTTSTDLATPGAFQTTLKGSFDGFVAKVGF